MHLESLRIRVGKVLLLRVRTSQLRRGRRSAETRKVVLCPWQRASDSEETMRRAAAYCMIILLCQVLLC